MNEIDEIIAGLKSSALFERLDDNILADIAHVVEICLYKEGETIVREGDFSDALFLINKGIVSVRKNTQGQQDKALAYLIAGNIFGEVGILEGSPRSASVYSLTQVSALLISRDSFMQMMHQYPVIAIELAKILGRYLTETNKRLTRGDKETKLIAIANIFGAGETSKFGQMISRKIFEKSEKPTAFIDLSKTKFLEIGNDVIDKSDALPKDIGNQGKLMITLDSLMNEYENLVVSIPLEQMQHNNFLLENSDQLIVPGSDVDFENNDLDKNLKGLFSNVDNYKAEVFKICLESFHEEQSNGLVSDDQLSTVENYQLNKEQVPGQFKQTGKFSQVIDSIVDRLDRNNRIGIIIPSTVDVNQPIDPGKYVEETLAFLGERFGGATCEVAQGIWNSSEVGLVGEQVFLVHSYTTTSNLRKHLDEVVEYVRILKNELRQEAMALEVNRKLTLI